VLVVSNEYDTCAELPPGDTPMVLSALTARASAGAGEKLRIFGLIDDRKVRYVPVSRHPACGYLFETKRGV